jgi:hypothetical protein
MPPDARPGEDPTDIITGTHKWKPSECSILGNDLAQVKPKKVVWSLQGYVRDNDINTVTALEELVGEERMDELSADWDVINI